MQPTSSFSFQVLEFLEHHSVPLTDSRVQTLHTLALAADRASMEKESLGRHVPTAAEILAEIVKNPGDLNEPKLNQWFARSEDLARVVGKMTELARLIENVQKTIRLDVELQREALHTQARRY